MLSFISSIIFEELPLQASFTLLLPPTPLGDPLLTFCCRRFSVMFAGLANIF
jgi:hypothetical protein